LDSGGSFKTFGNRRRDSLSRLKKATSVHVQTRQAVASTGFCCCLVWLEWPETCFRTSAADLGHLKTVVPKGATVVRVKTERAFLRELPHATHALVWRFEADWFARAPRLRVLATPAAGREFLPTEAPAGVTVHFGHYHGAIMSETVAAFVLAWARGFFLRPPADDAWPRTWMSDKCRTVAGTRAVVVGYGNVGRAIGAKLAALGLSVTGVTRHGLYVNGVCDGKASLDDALRAADWLVMALPSTTGTDDWLDAARLRKLPRRCVIVNVGRGNAVDEKALYAALKAKRLAGAFLDVRKHEPSATVLEAPGYEPRLAALPNCVSLPHASAFSPAYLRMFIDELAADGLFTR